MTSRERVLASIQHTEPDKVPIDLGGTICTTLTATANEKLKKFLKIDKGGEIVTLPIIDVVLPLEEILVLFETDTRTVRLRGPLEEGDEQKNDSVGFSSVSLSEKPQKHSVFDEYNTRWMKTGYDYSPVEFPLAEATVGDLKNYPWPDPYNIGRVRGIREEAKALRENTDFVILSDIMCGGPFEQCLWLRGYEQFLSDLIINPKFATALLEKVTEIDVGFWDALLTHVGDYVDIVCQGDDMGSQSGLQFSPEMYRRLIKPCHENLFSFIHSKTNAKVWLHSCGSVHAIIPDLIEVGVNILNPVQCGAKNMELRRLKKDFGNDIVFWGGGINVQVIPFMSVAEVEDHVKEALDIMAPGGGFVFAATHNILPETEGETTYTAYMTAKNYRDYSTIKGR
jgi:uroporphyrinogen decarboxylase